MATAGLIKHHLAAAPMAAVVCLWFIRPRSAMTAAVFGAPVCGVLALACWSVYGDAFFDQILAPREILLRKPIVDSATAVDRAPLRFLVLLVGDRRENAREAGDVIDDRDQLRDVDGLAFGFGSQRQRRTPNSLSHRPLRSRRRSRKAS